MYELTLIDDAEAEVFGTPAAYSLHPTEREAFDTLERILTSAEQGDWFTMPQPGQVRIFDRHGHKVGTASVSIAA